jgi:tetratricopeptide (TPR) repeat protein
LRSLGVAPTAIPDGLEERARLYRARLSGRHVLVVLDNAVDEAQVRPLLPGDAGCAVLVTSRNRLLGLEGAKTVDLDVLEPHEAIELISKVVGARRVTAEPQAAEELAHLCGYLPLAVRIAGARLAAKPHWTLAVYVARLRDECKRLEELRAGDLEVRASFVLSYQALSENEQHAFRLLGLLDMPSFQVWVSAALLGCALQIAEDLVERLVDVQLFEAAGQDATGRLRYRLHDLLRVFARECLREEEPAAVQQVALERTLAIYLRLAEQAGAHLGRDDHWIGRDTTWHQSPANEFGLAVLIEQDTIVWFKAEQESLVAAVTQAHSAGLWKLTWELADSLSVLFESRAQWSAWEHVTALALDATHKAADRRAEAHTLRSRGNVHRYRGRRDESMADFDRCLVLFAELGDQRGTAYTLLNAGVTHRYRAQFDDALSNFGRCLPLFEKLRDELGEAATRRNIGVIYRRRGQLDKAMVCLTQVLSVFQRCSAPLPAALTLIHLSIIHRDLGRLDDAMACTQLSLAVSRELGNRPLEALALQGLAEVYQSFGRLDDASESLNDCLLIVRELGDRHGEARALKTLGDLYRDQNRLEEAMHYFDQCLPVFREFGDRIGEADALLGLAMLYQALGRGNDAMNCFDKAMDCFKQSLFVFRQLRLPLEEARTLKSIGTLLASRGDHPAAEAAWRQALIIFRDLKVPEAAQVQAWLRP